MSSVIPMPLPTQSDAHGDWLLAEKATTIARILKTCDEILNGKPGFASRMHSRLDDTRFRSQAECAVMNLHPGTSASADHYAVVYAVEKAFDEHWSEYQQDQFPRQMIADAIRRAFERREVELEKAWRELRKGVGR